MKLCYFNYFLKENEKIVAQYDCRLKAISAFEIIDEKGVLLCSDARLLFCKVIGEHPHLLQSYEYKYLTNLSFKEDGKYLYGKYNGNPIKISEITKEEADKILHIINKRD